MSYTRPQGVSENAVPVPPVQLSPVQVLIAEFQAEGQPIPSWLSGAATQTNVQQATIQSVMISNAHDNVEAYKKDAQAVKDWTANNQRNIDIGMPKPAPLPTPKIVTKVTYATPDGAIVAGPGADSGANVAWLDQEWQ